MSMQSLLEEVYSELDEAIFHLEYYYKSLDPFK